MARLHDWQVRLEACLAQRWARPFAWGELDCCLFAADCVEAVTGVDPAADFRGQYSGLASAARLLSGAGGLEAAAAARLGAEILPAQAQVGDVGLSADDTGLPALVVCGGQHWLGITDTGLAATPAPVKAWRCC